MAGIGEAFRAYVRASSVEGIRVREEDNDRFLLEADSATGRVTFYRFEGGPEIVELSIDDTGTEGQPTFFLHFELEDLDRARALFKEMCDVLTQEELFETRRVLLCCTAGMTTTLFATRLNEAAKTLSLDYEFCALPLEMAREGSNGTDFEAVLLAPQIGYRRAEVKRAFPDIPVVEIPPKHFASYDAGSVLKMVMHLVGDHTVFSDTDPLNLKQARGLTNDRKIMVVVNVHNIRSTWTGWRIYDHGTIVDHGQMTRTRIDLGDIEDLIATLYVAGHDVRDLDAIGIAIPGVVNRESCAFEVVGSPGDYELGRRIYERYGVRVFVDNNANAAAVGCYVSQDEYDSVSFHTQQTGHLIGGHGIVVDGHLVKGRGNFAGELGPFAHALLSDRTDGDVKRLEEMAWHADGMRTLVTPILLADMSLVAPDAIFVAVDLIDDMDKLRADMASHLKRYPTKYLPDLIRVTDYRERIAVGELALCLQKLNNPRPHRRH